MQNVPSPPAVTAPADAAAHGWGTLPVLALPPAPITAKIARRFRLVGPVEALGLAADPTALAPNTRGLAWRLVATALGALLGVQFPLPWGGLIGAFIAAVLVEYVLGRRLRPRTAHRLVMRGVVGCLVGISLVPALANPVLLPTALWPVGLAATCWLALGAVIARVGRVDLLSALVSPTTGQRHGRRRYLVFALQQTRGLALLLLAIWLTQ